MDYEGWGTFFKSLLLTTDTTNNSKMNPLKVFPVSILLFLLVVGLSGCEEASVNPGGMNTPPPPTDTAPPFTLTSVDGGLVSQSSFLGKPLVIFFFGSSCPLCVSSAPTVESGIKQNYQNNEINIIGIDTWDGNQVTVENFRNTTNVTFDLLLMGSSVEKAYGTTYDRLVVIDADGKIVFKGSTSASNDVDDVQNVLEDLLM